MSRLPDDFYQDRALRDAARDVLVADVEHAKATLSGKAIAGRVAGRVGDGAKDVFEIAKVQAGERQGLLAGLIALLSLWFAREPLAEILGMAAEGDTIEDADERPLDESSLDEGQSEGEGPLEDEADETMMPEQASEPAEADLEPISTGETV